MRTILGLICWGAFASSAALAATINYTDKMGTNVMFTNISETDINAGSDGVARFGDPTASGNSLDFDPIDFDATTTSAGGSDNVDVQLNFTVMAKPGTGFSTITLTESGDTALTRGFGAGLDAFTSVTAKIFVDILEVDGSPISQISLNQMMGFNPSAGDYQLSVDGGAALSFNAIWTGATNFNLAAELTTRNIPFALGVTKARVALDNTLFATSTPGAAASIVKKDTDAGVIRITIDENEIPEPTTMVLVGLGLAAFAVARRR